MSDWKPIETAPKDGSYLWCYTYEGEHRSCRWVDAEADGPDYMGSDAGWADSGWATCPGRSFGNSDYYYDAHDQPVFWQPLPADPSSDQLDKAFN